MISIKNILCPTDFSEDAENAIKYGVEFAKRFEAILHLHHVVNVPYMSVAYEIGPDVVAARETAENYAKDYMAKKAKELEAAGVNVHVHLSVGTPFVDIVALAKEKGIDLIIVATHGKGAIEHMLMGSTAERIVRKAPCPVLTVKHPEREFVMP